MSKPLVAEKIRKFLLNVDLRLVQATNEYELASEQYHFYSKLGGKVNERKALDEKVKRECYKIHIKNLKNIRENTTFRLDRVLDKYVPRYRKIWYMYFISQLPIDKIAKEVSFSPDNVNKVVRKLKDDMLELENKEN